MGQSEQQINESNILQPLIKISIQKATLIQFFLTVASRSSSVERMVETGKSTLGKYGSNYYRTDPAMDAKTSKQGSEEKKAIYMVHKTGRERKTGHAP